MSLSFSERVVGFLSRPAETFRAVRGDPMTEAAVYFLLLLVIHSVLFGLMVYLGLSAIDGSGLGIETGRDAGIVSLVWAAVFAFVWGLFTLVVWAVVLQIGATALRGRGSFADCFNIAVYAQTPYLLLGWIPVVGWVLTQLWAVWLTIVGVRELHALDTAKAAAVAVVALLLYLMVSWVLGLFGITVATGLAGLMGLLA